MFQVIGKFDIKECSLKVVYISIYNDKKYEEDEEFLFELYSLPDNITLGFDRVLVVIARNDITRGEIRVYPFQISLVEGMKYKLQIQRTNGKVDKARVCYQLQSGTAKIEFGLYHCILSILSLHGRYRSKQISDVMPAQDCVEWNHNDNQTYLVTIDTISDDLWEGDEVFYVKLLNVEGASLSQLHSQATITILQNNCMFFFSFIPFVICNIYIYIYIYSKCTIHCIDSFSMFRIQEETPNKSIHRKTILCAI